MTPSHPTCHLCTSSGNVWVTAVPVNGTIARPDIGQCFLRSGPNISAYCSVCMNADEWKHVTSPSDCFAYNGSMTTSLFANPSTTCLQVMPSTIYAALLSSNTFDQCTYSKQMFWCQIEGICVSDLTQCYFPGAVVPDDWASCTVSSIVINLPTCRFCASKHALC